MTRALMSWTTSLAVLMAAVTTSCATAALRAAPDADHAESSSSDVITTADLKRLDRGQSVMDAVEHGWPWFLHSRGSVSMVSIDNSPPAEASVLRTITVDQVREIRLLRASGRSGLAGIRADGSVVVGDVVLVVTARGRP